MNLTFYQTTIMKKIKKIGFIPERKVSSTKLLFLLFALLVNIGFISCSKEELNLEASQKSAEINTEANLTTKAASSGTTIQEIPFSAVALISDCYGENIAFTGMIQNRVSKTTDATGLVHYTRSFSTRGMTGTGTITGTQFDVIGGAEMFAIKNPVFNAQGMLSVPGSLTASEILIHQGTLVFQSRTDGSKVVVRHIIRKVPGQEEWVSKWQCGGK